MQVICNGKVKPSVRYAILQNTTEIIVNEKPHDLLKLRAQLSKAEKQARRQKSVVQATIPPKRPPVVARLGINTDEWTLQRAYQLIRNAIYDDQFEICPHAVQHARAEGFLENDILDVLLSGQLRAIYTEERRYLVCGYWEAQGIQLPLHVVLENRNGFVSVVTAFVPRYPHEIISRSRLAVLLRYDSQTVHAKKTALANKVGYKSKGRWRRAAPL